MSGSYLQKANGFVRLKGHRKIAINFPEDVFEKIKRRAEAERVSFSVKAVELVSCGLLDYEDSEKHEQHRPLWIKEILDV